MSCSKRSFNCFNIENENSNRFKKIRNRLYQQQNSDEDILKVNTIINNLSVPELKQQWKYIGTNKRVLENGDYCLCERHMEQKCFIQNVISNQILVVCSHCASSFMSSSKNEQVQTNKNGCKCFQCSSYKVDFGKWRGYSYKYVSENDPKYCQWVVSVANQSSNNSSPSSSPNSSSSNSSHNSFHSCYGLQYFASYLTNHGYKTTYFNPSSQPTKNTTLNTKQYDQIPKLENSITNNNKDPIIIETEQHESPLLDYQVETITDYDSLSNKYFVHLKPIYKLHGKECTWVDADLVKYVLYKYNPKIKKETEQIISRPPAIDIDEDGTPIFNVDKIIGKRSRQKNKLWLGFEYLVLWQGYPESEATWEPEEHLKHLQNLIKDYESLNNNRFV
jgi:hypothetical protein